MPPFRPDDGLHPAQVRLRQVRAVGRADVEVRDWPLSRTRSDTIASLSELVGRTPVHKRDIGMVFQNYALGLTP